MKRFSGDTVYQGDLAITSVSDLPPGCVAVPLTGGRNAVGHSETGNHHFVAAAEARFYGTSDPLVCYLSVDESADLVHDRIVNPHETWRLPKGTYRISRQREITPEGWVRTIQD